MMPTIQEELAHKIYANPRFREDLERLFSRFFFESFGLSNKPSPIVDYSWIKRLAESAVIMASSSEALHQKISYDIATLFIESRLENLAGIGGLMKIVCARLGNIPALGLLKNSVDNLPQSLEIEAQMAILQHTITISDSQLELTDFQYASYEQLLQGFSLSLSAPTSAGKSFIITQFLAQQFMTRQSFCAVVVVPTRALIRQMTLDVQDVLRSYSLNRLDVNSIELITSSIEPSNTIDSPKKLFVLTQERLQAILHNWSSTPSFDFVVVDESQKISDTKRGIILEDTITELTSVLGNIQYVFLSPLTRNPDFLLEFLTSSPRKNAIHTIISPVTQHIYEVSQVPRKTKLLEIRKLEAGLGEFGVTVPLDHPLPKSKTERLAFIAHILGMGQNNIIYASGPVEAEKIALALSSIVDANKVTAKETQETVDFLSNTIHEEYHLVNCLKKGVAYHYGSMPDIAKISVEDLFKNNLIGNVSCTSTLLEGVNLPAKNIFIENPKLGRIAMDDSSFWNLAGRAGRLLKDFSGNVFCINSRSWDRPVSERERQYQIESSLTKTLRSDQFLVYCQSPSAQTDTESCEQALNSLALRIIEKGITDTTHFLDARVSPQRRTDILSMLNTTVRTVNIPVAILKKNKSIDIRLQQIFFDYLSNFELRPYFCAKSAGFY